MPSSRRSGFLSSLLSSGFSGFGGAKTGVGLSIGSSSVKLVEIARKNGNWRILHFGMVQLPEDFVADREISNGLGLVEALRTLVGQIKLKNKRVCLSVAGSSIVIKRMLVEVPNPKEIQDQVFWEAEQYIPYDISEVVMDYHVLSRGRDNRTDVILVAVKKTTLESYMACVEDAGLDPSIVDIDFFALQNSFEANYPSSPSQSILIADLGASSTKVVIVQDKIPVFTKDSSFGGRNVTAEIQKFLNLSYNDAESLKTGEQGGSVPQEVSEILQVACENFAQEIRRAVDIYNASSGGAPIGAVLLAGGSSKLNDLPRHIEDAVGVQVQLLNPFTSVSFDPQVFAPDYMEAVGPIAAVPVGLALRAGAGGKA